MGSSHSPLQKLPKNVFKNTPFLSVAAWLRFHLGADFVISSGVIELKPHLNPKAILILILYFLLFILIIFYFLFFIFHYFFLFFCFLKDVIFDNLMFSKWGGLIRRILSNLLMALILFGTFIVTFIQNVYYFFRGTHTSEINDWGATRGFFFIHFSIFFSFFH